MSFAEKVLIVGTVDTDVYICPATFSGSVHGLVFSNITGADATVTLKHYSQASGQTTVFASALKIAANTPLAWPKPINVVAGDKLICAASTANAITVLTSVYLGSSAPAAAGLTARGTYTDQASYVLNDVVTLVGTSYINVSPCSGVSPPSGNWMVLALKGDTGAQGLQGIQGIKGDKGDQGAQGNQGPVGPSVAVLDEGGSLTVGATSLNFVGTGVVASANGNAITITIQAATAAGLGLGSVENKSVAQILANAQLTGVTNAVNIVEAKVAMAAGNNIDMATGTLFAKTITGAATLTVSNIPAAGLGSFLLDVTNGGSATITWWANIKWAGGTAPALTAAGRDMLGFLTYDAGATWTGLVLGKNIK
ncbi:hypothetical protein ACO0LG_22705 [Undibacterium sp. Ji42W]|uniref:hypothetical protein n=1 Tax=Undibacterium sp. Ji42W TaxID=3413039 RepID=UPI003BF3C9B8